MREPATASNKPELIIAEPSTIIVKNEAQHDQGEVLRLLYFDDDITQYDGIQLWSCMYRRCLEHFQGTIRGSAITGLQQLRCGEADSETIFMRLCELSGHDKTFRTYLQNFLGILKNFHGGSLFKAPFNLHGSLPTPISAKKPQNQCLTCIHEGRECRESYRTGTRCVECHADRMNGNAPFEADECYWQCADLGLLTYSSVENCLAYDDGSSRALKRKADDEDISNRPMKRGKKARSVFNRVAEFLKTPWGPFPAHLAHSRHQEPVSGRLGVSFLRKLIDEHGTQLTADYFSTTMVSVQQFKSIRSALEWSRWEFIRSKGQVKTFTSRPNYTFEIRKFSGASIVSLSEEQFLQYDRDLAAGRVDWVKLGLQFICKGRPGVKAP